MARRKKGERILGPYWRAREKRWVLIHIRPDGTRTGARTESPHASEDEALAFKRECERDIAGALLTIDEALTAYERFLRADKRNKDGSVSTTITRVKGFFPSLDLTFEMVTEAACKRWYKALVDAKKTVVVTEEKVALAAKMGVTIEPGPVKVAKYADDTHRNMLAETKTFLRWCVAQAHIVTNPAESVMGTGKRNPGKAQLSIDEARRWEAVALKLADEGEEGAIAALLTLYLGLRQGEVIGLTARSLDDGGRKLHVATKRAACGWRSRARRSPRSGRSTSPRSSSPCSAARRRGASASRSCSSTQTGG
jgi:integrase